MTGDPRAQPFGLYLHVPFCRAKCPYCDFYSTTATARISDYIEALTAELTRRRDAGLGVDSVYFGGGTPSLLAPGQIEGILNAPPIDGLWEDERTDESQLGATYAELEWAMQFEGASGDENDLNTRQREVLAIYRKFHRANKHKMDPIPICKIPEFLR